MRESTNSLLGELRDLAWFHAAGKPVKDENIVSVTRWLDALGYLESGYWEMLGYQQGIAMEDAVKKFGKGMNKRWKEAVVELRPLAREIVMQNMRPIREKREWPVQVDMIADYDLSYALLEKEFSDLVNSGFFGMKAHWYLQGHLPCGVTEEGKLVIY